MRPDIFRCLTASSKVSVDPLPANGFPRVLQGQEFSTLRGNIAESNESDTAEKSVAWPPAVDDEKMDVVSTSRRYGSESWMSMGRNEATYSDLLSGFGAGGDPSHASMGDQMTHVAYPARKPSVDHEGNLHVHHTWHVTPSGLSLNLLDNTKGSAHGGDTAYQARGSSRYTAFGEYPMLHGHKVEHSHGNLMPHPSSTQYQSPRSRELMSKPLSVKACEAVKPKDGDCKLFGISLISSPVAPEPSVSQRNGTTETADPMHIASRQHRTSEDQNSDHSKGSKLEDGQVVVYDPEKSFQTSHLHLKDVQSKSQSSARSCTKVRSFTVD